MEPDLSVESTRGTEYCVLATYICYTAHCKHGSMADCRKKTIKFGYNKGNGEKEKFQRGRKVNASWKAREMEGVNGVVTIGNE